MPNQDLLVEIIAKINAIKPGSAVMVDTKLLSELDLDSLAVVEICEWVDQRFGVDILDLEKPHLALTSPGAIADAISRSRPRVATEPPIKPA